MSAAAFFGLPVPWIDRTTLPQLHRSGNAPLAWQRAGFLVRDTTQRSMTAVVDLGRAALPPSRVGLRYAGRLIPAASICLRMAYLYLVLAIVTEVVATTALKASDGFTRLGPSLVVALGYGLAFYFLALVLRTLPVGVAYAIWAGAGIALVTLLAALTYREIPDLPALVGMGLIIVGVVMIIGFSDTTR